MFEWGQAQGVTLCLHGVGPPTCVFTASESNYWLPERMFESVLDRVLEDPTVTLTFDDGFSSDVDVVLPALVDRGLTASFFPPTHRLGMSGCLSEDGVRELRSAGMTIGSHGRDHVPWERMTPGRAYLEFVVARQELESILSEPVTSAACPFGAYDPRTLKRLKEQGYTRVFTSDAAKARQGRWLSPRFTLTADMSSECVQQMMEGRTRIVPGVADELRLLAKRLW